MFFPTASFVLSTSIGSNLLLVSSCLTHWSPSRLSFIIPKSSPSRSVTGYGTCSISHLFCTFLKANYCPISHLIIVQFLSFFCPIPHLISRKIFPIKHQHFCPKSHILFKIKKSHLLNGRFLSNTALISSNLTLFLNIFFYHKYLSSTNCLLLSKMSSMKGRLL